MHNTNDNVVTAFYDFYRYVLTEVGSSVMDFVDDYLLGNSTLSSFRYEVSGSCIDSIKDLKVAFTTLIDNNYDIDISLLRQLYS